jgi:hypothetical protein
MPNPRGNLAGWSDPSDPNWRENALRRVRERQTKKHPNVRARRRGVLQLFFDPEYMLYLDEAARRRGMSVGSYGRRAVATWVARDLGIPVTEILQHCAEVSPYGSKAPGGPRPPGVKTQDDGEGYGDWSM